MRFFKFEKPKSLSKLKIKDKVIDIELADTPQSREMGLSGRDGLPQNTGMYFIFEKADRHAFWMKDMKFDLDFIWIQNGRVVYLSEHVSNPATIYPPMPVDRVLEVPSDFVQQNHIAVGDKIEVW